MTSYTDIIPDSLTLERTPADPNYAPRSWDKALLRIEDGYARIISRSYYGGDGVPVKEWHDEVLTFALASSFHGEAALDVERLAGDLEEGGKLNQLIGRIIAGHTVEWDGNNYVGRLTRDAQDAADELQQLDPYVTDVPEDMA